MSVLRSVQAEGTQIRILVHDESRRGSLGFGTFYSVFVFLVFLFFFTVQMQNWQMCRADVYSQAEQNSHSASSAGSW